MYFERNIDKKLVYEKAFNTAFKESSGNFQKELTNWNKNFDVNSLDRLICNCRLKTKKEWTRMLNDILVITPSTYFNWLADNLRNEIDNKKRKLIPKPGKYLLEDENRGSFEQKIIYSEALIDFLFNKDVINKDFLEVVQKKFALILAYESMLLIAFRFIRNKRSTHLKKEDSTSLPRKIFEQYWEKYCELGFNYSNFDEDFWYICNSINFHEKLEVRKILTSHIKDNIEDFIKNYTNKDLHNSNIYLLFTEYDVDPNGRGASETREWLPNFIKFLERIENKSENLKRYIETIHQ